jgi:hypothetical protein
MKTLSVRQPWASLIVSGAKDCENRSWATSYRGPLLIHAGLAVDSDAFDFIVSDHRRAFAVHRLASRDHDRQIDSPRGVSMDLPRGCVIGRVQLVACVRDSTSPWAEAGAWHWILRDAQEIPHEPLRGRLGLFDHGPRDQLSLAV